jgi:hypothetical protein
VDVLRARTECEVKCLFTPEHGFSGAAAAGEEVRHGTHPETGLPIFSLYGTDRAPRIEWIESLDLVVIDLKDLGVRCYTYATTLLETLLVCAEAGVPVVVLDRKTPLEGIVDGPDLADDCISFVGKVPLPLVYGLSQGKLALTLQEKIPELHHLKLEIFAGITDLESPWTPPSPAIVSPDAARCYPVTVWSEAVADIHVDRGGRGSFQVWAMPDFPTSAFPAEEVLYGYRLRSAPCATTAGTWAGLKLAVEEPISLKPISLAHTILERLCRELGSERLFSQPGCRPEFFDQLAGTTTWRESLVQGKRPEFMETG